ncbi:uncharacterized protein LAESUDRAFT_716231 [Laetiporus sulphureus 93-53]|uniref:Uncharacterized protein n=1 Tax=Laetiporus sulphureus 93-53 TaxID=1314785 RepID=A0A165CTN3_9APHY|nr:uncharacterized protein LAESUDRAFT_716231 [Laetiporus sulphureus 93-53]KZT03416.1 hypothetical protein LAESUDRAFT_716231 [Laetiporus sulphureus 93-53]
MRKAIAPEVYENWCSSEELEENDSEKGTVVAFKYELPDVLENDMTDEKILAGPLVLCHRVKKAKISETSDTVFDLAAEEANTNQLKQQNTSGTITSIAPSAQHVNIDLSLLSDSENEIAPAVPAMPEASSSRITQSLASSPMNLFLFDNCNGTCLCHSASCMPSHTNLKHAEDTCVGFIIELHIDEHDGGIITESMEHNMSVDAVLGSAMTWSPKLFVIALVLSMRSADRARKHALQIPGSDPRSGMLSVSNSWAHTTMFMHANIRMCT